MAVRSFVITTLMSMLGFVALGGLVAASLLVATPSHACWDGVYVETSRVTLTDSQLGDRWTPSLARDVGLWVSRVEALLPDDVHLTVQHGIVEVCGVQGNEDFGCVEPDERWNDGELASLFDVVARALDVDAPDRALAIALLTRPVTLQLGAFKTRKAARRFAYKVSETLDDADVDLFGFLEAGAFPAENAFAHVIHADGRYRVVVGAFLDRDEARLAGRQIKQLAGYGTYIRDL